MKAVVLVLSGNADPAHAWLKINYPQIPVIALHSKNDHTSLEKLLKGGAAGYIFKTADPHEVNSIIKEVLGSNKYFMI